MTNFTRVVVGVDASDAARVALQWAMQEAVRRDAILEVLHAWREPLFIPDAYPVGMAALADVGAMNDVARAIIQSQLDAVPATVTRPDKIELHEVNQSA